jgi:hypothetical protein
MERFVARALGFDLNSLNGGNSSSSSSSSTGQQLDELGRLARDESGPREPILVLAGTGAADPSPAIRECATRVLGGGGGDRLQQIAMGQGLDRQCMDALKKCMQSGDWLLLNNVHLTPAVLPRLMQVNRQRNNLYKK